MPDSLGGRWQHTILLLCNSLVKSKCIRPSHRRHLARTPSNPTQSYGRGPPRHTQPPSPPHTRPPPPVLGNSNCASGVPAHLAITLLLAVLLLHCTSESMPCVIRKADSGMFAYVSCGRNMSHRRIHDTCIRGNSGERCACTHTATPRCRSRSLN